jgi:O-antigen/teichoic acid export membrane protein
MGVTLFTSRVLLRELGVDKYGVWNLLAGVVVLFSFVQNSMATAVQRFISFALGKKDYEQTYLILYNSKTIHILLSILFIIISEIAGNLFIVFVLNIPEHLIKTTFILFQIIVLNTVFLINRIPYNSWVIAHENMSFYSITSIIEGVLQLVAVYLLCVLPGDNLINYGLLCIGTTFAINAWFLFYCKAKWKTQIFKYSHSKAIFAKLLSFSSYTMLGSIASIARTQGLNVLINYFFSVAANAAMGIATQVNGAVLKFVTNFQTAFKPQIVKLYSANDSKGLNTLIFSASKISFFLMWVLACPILLNTDFILELWLGNVPEYTSVLCKFMIVCSLLECISSPLWMTVQATGNIKAYQITVSATMLSTLVLSFFLFEIWGKIYSALICKMFIDVVVLAERLFFSKKLFQFDFKKFLLNNVLMFAVIACISLGVMLFVKKNFGESENIFSFTVLTMCSIFVSCLIIALFERKKLLSLKRMMYAKK